MALPIRQGGVRAGRWMVSSSARRRATRLASGRLSCKFDLARLFGFLLILQWAQPALLRIGPRLRARRASPSWPARLGSARWRASFHASATASRQGASRGFVDGLGAEACGRSSYLPGRAIRQARLSGPGKHCVLGGQPSPFARFALDCFWPGSRKKSMAC